MLMLQLMRLAGLALFTAGLVRSADSQSFWSLGSLVDDAAQRGQTQHDLLEAGVQRPSLLARDKEQGDSAAGTTAKSSAILPRRAFGKGLQL